MRPLLAASGLLLLATACGGSERAAQRPPPPGLAERCPQDIDLGRTLWFRASDGTRLSGVVLGDGEVGVVLAHGFPSDLCDWVEFAPVLARAGFRALFFDFRGMGLSDRGRSGDYLADVRGAAAELRRQGTRRIVLMGSSFGGTAVLAAAVSMRPRPAGVVSLSGPIDLSGRVPGFDAMVGAPRLHSALLLLSARGDPAVEPPDARTFIRRAAARDKAVVFFPGAWHGTGLLDDAPFRARASRIVLEFLRRR